MGKPIINVKVDNPEAEVQIIRPTPQHDRLREVKAQSQALHEFFLEFCADRGMVLAIYGEDDEYRPIACGVELFIAEFLGIDTDELENEKRRMLIDIRTNNARRDAEKELPLFKSKK